MKFLVQNKMRGTGKVAFVVALVLLIVGVSLRDELGYWFTSLITPPVQALWSIKNIDDGVSSVGGREYALQSRLDYLTEENAILKNALNHTMSTTSRMVNILSSLYSSPYDTFVIDEGSDEGLLVGDKVITLEGVILGELIEVYPSVAKVSLYSTVGRELEVLLDNTIRVRVKGIGNQNFFADLPQGIPVSTSSTLSFPGDGEYMLATVGYIKNNVGDAFQKVYARSPVNVHHVKFVYVIPQ